MQPFLLRSESFGGLIIDRDKGHELMLNKSGFLIAMLYFQEKLSVLEIVALLEDISSNDNYDFENQVKKIVNDVESYFYSNSTATAWESSYSPLKDIQVLSSPISVFWEIASACNLRCRHCYHASGDQKSNDLTETECFDLIKELAGLGVYKLIIGGGEPFIRSDFVNIVELADGLGMSIVVATNGTLLNENTCRRLRSEERRVG